MKEEYNGGTETLEVISEANSFNHELERFRERRVDQIRDCKREAYSPLKNQHSLALLQGKMRKFLESS